MRECRGYPEKHADERSDGACPRSRLLRWAAPLSCIVAVVAILLGAIRVIGNVQEANQRAGDEPVASRTADGQGEADVEASAGNDGAEDADGDAQDVSDASAADNLLSEYASSVTSETFLAALDSGDADGPGVVSVAWEDEAGLVALAGDVLKAYRECPGAQLQTSGYLDLKGNAWGAIVNDGTSWVDIVVVYTTEDGGACAQVSRMSSRDKGQDDATGHAERS